MLRYIKKLVEIFHICEDLENRESLSILYQIFKSIFMLNKNSIYEILFSEDLIEDVVGVLEYDPISPVKKNHREYLWKMAKFKVGWRLIYEQLYSFCITM